MYLTLPTARPQETLGGTEERATGYGGAWAHVAAWADIACCPNPFLALFPWFVILGNRMETAVIHWPREDFLELAFQSSRGKEKAIEKTTFDLSYSWRFSACTIGPRSATPIFTHCAGEEGHRILKLWCTHTCLHTHVRSLNTLGEKKRKM